MIERPHILDTLRNYSEDWKASQVQSSFVLNFIASKYAVLFFVSKIQMLHAISHEWSRFVYILLRVFCMRYKTIFSKCFPNIWYQSGLQSHVCITCWVSFRIKENCFHVFENSAVIFLHILELLFDKTNIDVMMLFKFDFNLVIMNLETIASMEFSFDLNLILIWSRNYVLFKWNVKNSY